MVRLLSQDPLTRLIDSTVTDMFGERVAAVATDIAGFSVKTLGQIVSSTGMSVKEVRGGLGVLVHHGLVRPSDTRRPGTVDYTLGVDRVLSLLRFSRYLQLVRAELGEEAELMVEEVFRSGPSTASSIIFRTAKRLNDSLADPEVEKKTVTAFNLFPKLKALISTHLLGQCPLQPPAAASDQTPGVCPPFWAIDVKELIFTEPDVDLKAINSALTGNQETPGSVKDGSMLWVPNFSKLTQLLRDQMISAAAGRRIDNSAGEIVQSLLKLVDTQSSAEDSGTAAVSTQINHHHLVDQVATDHGKESRAFKFLDQYLRLLGDDKTRFVDRVGDQGGGSFIVDIKHVCQSIAECSLDCIVLEKFGSKALRIFRYIREKKYVEEGQLQQVVMIPSKETKMLTYQLLENHFIHLQELRKSVAPNAPSKAVYLYYVNIDQVVRSAKTICYKAMFNCRSRAAKESQDNCRLLDKQERIESIAASLRTSGGTEEQLEEVDEMMTPPEKEAVARVHQQLDKLTRAQLQADETLFMLETCLSFKSS